jgi:hypothetical protein
VILIFNSPASCMIHDTPILLVTLDTTNTIGIYSTSNQNLGRSPPKS